jgi:hypothetical protein
MGWHGASAGSIPRRSQHASIEVLGFLVRLEGCCSKDKPQELLPAFSRRAGSRTEAAGGCFAAASRRIAPWDLNRFGI